MFAGSSIQLIEYNNTNSSTKSPNLSASAAALFPHLRGEALAKRRSEEGAADEEESVVAKNTANNSMKEKE